jgi:SAM-dependent methyltransferase
MPNEHAELYDIIYTAMGKDYAAEAEKFADLVRRARPHCRTLLDVGCGTGEHARLLGEVHGFEVDGIDISPEMITSARAKYPRGRFDLGDMVDFQLGRRYDGVLNLFGAIAHAVTLPRLRDTLACMRDHLAPGGVAIVQPYLTPDQLQVGTAEYTLESGDLRITRTRHSKREGSEREGQHQRLSIHFTVEGPDGTQELDELHDLGLFTVEQTLAAFSAVGLAATYDPGSPDELGGHGFYVASAPA